MRTVEWCDQCDAYHPAGEHVGDKPGGSSHDWRCGPACYMCGVRVDQSGSGGPCRDTKPGDLSVIEAKVEASSLGTPEAKALRATVSDERAARVVARSKEIGADPKPGDSEVDHG